LHLTQRLGRYSSRLFKHRSSRYGRTQWGMDVKTREEGDLYAMGIIDPLKVTRSALENAVSVASTLLSTNAIITMARTYEDK